MRNSKRLAALAGLSVGLASVGVAHAAPVAIAPWHVRDGAADQPTLQLDTLTGGPTAISVGYVDGACGYVNPHDPTVVGTGLEWIAEGSPCERTVTDVALLDPARHERRVFHGRGGLTLSLTRDGRDTYRLRGHGSSCAGRASRCLILRDRDLSLRRVARGKALGPEPEDG